ncbi:response regulator [Spirosoma areae]
MAFHFSTNATVPTSPAVWVVDDDEDDRLFICAAFEDTQRSIGVRTLSDGEMLLPNLAKADELPRLILLDINMARQNGFDTLAQLRNSTDFAHLPVVMLTTSTEITDRQRSLALGANQCLTKPARYEQLVSLVNQLTEQWALA